MGNKINPILLRLGINRDWKSKWFAKGFKFSRQLEEDFLIRKIVKDSISKAGIDSIVVKKTGNSYKIIVCVSRPGLVIGRGGKGIESLTKNLTSKINKLRKQHNNEEKAVLSVDIEEIKRYEISAQVTAQQIAWDLERRMPYRRVMKKYIQNVMQTKGVDGVKIRVSGRLNGAEIARAEKLSEGSVPLHTIRSDIDYGEAISYTTYGTIGVKVWINKGKKFAISTENY